MNLNDYNKFKKKVVRINQDKDTAYQTFFRDIASYISYILISFPISPNQITFLGVLLQIPALIFFFFVESKIMIFIGILILYFVKILDKVDGQIARYKKKFSKRGLYLDGIIHSLSSRIVFLGIGFGLYFFTRNVYYLIFGFFAAFFSLFIQVLFLNRLLIVGGGADASKQNINISNNIKSFKFINIIKSIIFFPNQFILEILFIMNLFGYLNYFILFYGVYEFIYMMIIGFVYSLYSE